jgi:BirA family biotin operon repressor/biotin-[acetyl-CoA-carboxylase] ligase
MTSDSRARLLGLLADGCLHSGGDLAARLGVSRTAIWKLVADLREAGIAVESVARRGYRLPQAVELLDTAHIRLEAEALGASLPAALEVLFEVDSTNEYLHRSQSPEPGRPRVVLAELQHAGRGRRGRSWFAPFGSGLTFSIAWAFREVPADLGALGLAVGVSVAESLRAAGATETMLKWPNDIVWRRRKLGGLLLQLRSEAGGAASVVVGLGLNLALPDDTRSLLAACGATPVADLADALEGPARGRNALAARLVTSVLACLERFGRDGYAPFVGRWKSLDSLAGARVQVIQGDGRIEGVALGADDDGALRVSVNGRVERFYAGDVSLRTDTATS